MRNKLSVILLVVAALVLAVSCSEDPQAPAAEEDVIQWPDMTSRDDPIKVVVLAYENPKSDESLSQYNAVLHSLYFFSLHESDVEPGGAQIMARALDIASTEWLFDVHTMLELTITETGSWYERDELEGNPCENCWETQRAYFVRAQFGDETTIYQSPPERAQVQIIVAPDENDSTKWVLRAMCDLGI